MIPEDIVYSRIKRFKSGQTANSSQESYLKPSSGVSIEMATMSRSITGQEITGVGKYSGTVKENGYGSMEYKNGDIYHGYFVNGNRHGDGLMQYKNGDIYNGMWLNNQRHGIDSSYYCKATNTATHKAEWRYDKQINKNPPTVTDGQQAWKKAYR